MVLRGAGRGPSQWPWWAGVTGQAGVEWDRSQLWLGACWFRSISCSERGAPHRPLQRGNFKVIIIIVITTIIILEVKKSLSHV